MPEKSRLNGLIGWAMKELVWPPPRGRPTWGRGAPGVPTYNTKIFNNTSIINVNIKEKLKGTKNTWGLGLLQDPFGRPLFLISTPLTDIADNTGLGVVLITVLVVDIILGRYVDMSGVPKYISLGIFVSSSELDEEDSEALKLKYKSQ